MRSLKVGTGGSRSTLLHVHTGPHPPHLKSLRHPPSMHANSALPCCIRSKKHQKRPGHNTKYITDTENLQRPVKNPSKSARSRQKAIGNTRDQDSRPTPISPENHIILNDSDGYQLIGCSPTRIWATASKYCVKSGIFRTFAGYYARACDAGTKRQIKNKTYDIKRN